MQTAVTVNGHLGSISHHESSVLLVIDFFVRIQVRGQINVKEESSSEDTNYLPHVTAVKPASHYKINRTRFRIQKQVHRLPVILQLNLGSGGRPCQYRFR